ncbi:MAG: hypothetical protein GX627_03240, partial [Parcubacteria group bacterium]|nr:hypothetical protein [Parcubacteria group bacterium]
MNKAIYFKGKKFISTSEASKLTGYTGDYIGQLCRAKKVSSKLMGRSWYVCENEILEYKKNTRRAPKKSKKLKNKNNISKTSGFVSKTDSDNISKKDKNVFSDSKRFDKKSELLNIFQKKDNVISGIRDNNKVKTLYLKDERELFPILNKKFDIEQSKFIALKTLQESIEKPKIKSKFESFIISFSTTIVALSLIGLFVFGNFEKSKIISGFWSNLKSEVAYIYKPSFKKIEDRNFEEDNVKQFDQLALAGFSDGWKSISRWAGNIASKVLRPWFSNQVVLLVRVEEDRRNEEKVVVKNTEISNQNQAKVVYLTGSDRNYVDTKIAELKNYFLTHPFNSSVIAPNVNRYYITNQNDRIVDLISRSSRNSSGGGSSNVATLNDLTDLSLNSPTYGEVLLFDGSNWINVATSSLGITSVGLDTNAVNAFINASTTIAKLYTDNVWTGINTIAADKLNITGVADGCVEFLGGSLTSTGVGCGTSGGGVTSLNGLTTSSQTFATSTTDSGLTISIVSAGNTHTFTPGVQAGYEIPLSASTTNWNTF